MFPLGEEIRIPDNTFGSTDSAVCGAQRLKNHGNNIVVDPNPVGDEILLPSRVWINNISIPPHSDPKLCIRHSQFCGSVTCCYGSGRPNIPYGSGSGYGFGTLVKSRKEATKQLKSRFFLLFLLDYGRIRSRIRSQIRTCDKRILMRIREAQKHTDSTDSDPDD
jgi:hypothetical protein